MSSPSPAAKRVTVIARRWTLPALRLVRPDRYSDADPFRVIEVPTDQITHMQRRWEGRLHLPWLDQGRVARLPSLRRRWHAGAVLGGDWDRSIHAFADYHLSRVLRARFVQGAAWDEIPYVRRALRKVRVGEPAWGGRCRTEEDVRARCRYLDDLHDRLARHGYSSDVASEDRLDFTYFLVNIGRDGTIIRNNDGKHRIILAQLLGIATLRCRVLVRHRSWQHVRDLVRSGRASNDLVAEVADHPDLQDLVTGTRSVPRRPG